MITSSRRGFIAALATASIAESKSLAVPVRENGLTQAAYDFSLLDRIQYGADYYAEDWPPERIETDARLMRQAGFRLVRLADTNWERMELEEGRYDFEWLDRALKILARFGMKTVLCTSSYIPPAWMARKHPEFFVVNEKGVRRRWGGMGFVCLNNPMYRQYLEKLITALSKHYGQDSRVVGWQVDNEMGPPGSECFDEQYCLPRFREYLQDKFKTIDELNRRLLTVSYGHSYSSWDQIQLRADVSEDMLQAPIVLEAKRFFSANIVQFIAFQTRILRQHTAKQFITHNVFFNSMNCFNVANQLDFLSEDCYPLVGQYTAPAFTTDLMRGFNRGRSFQVLEMRSGQFGPYTLGDATPPPGLVRLWAWQTLAHGADGILFFRWRMNNGGSEQYWQGLLNYDGSPSPVFREAAQLGKELENIGPAFLRAESPADVACIFSYDSRWALEIGDKFPYLEQLRMFCTAFRRRGLNVDLVEPTADLSKYRIVAAPSLHLVTPETGRSLEEFVNRGGLLILTARSGFKNEDDLATVVPPGPLQSLARIRVTESTLLGKGPAPGWLNYQTDLKSYGASRDNAIRSVVEGWSREYTVNNWVEILECSGAKPLFEYKKDFYAGRPAVTLAERDKGKVVYVATLLEPDFYFDLVPHACRWASVAVGGALPEGVDFALRRKDKRDFRFLLNFTEAAQSVDLPGRHRDLISQKVSTDRATLDPLQVGIFVEE